MSEHQASQHIEVFLSLRDDLDDCQQAIAGSESLRQYCDRFRSILTRIMQSAYGGIFSPIWTRYPSIEGPERRVSLERSSTLYSAFEIGSFLSDTVLRFEQATQRYAESISIPEHRSFHELFGQHRDELAEALRTAHAFAEVLRSDEP